MDRNEPFLNINNASHQFKVRPLSITNSTIDSLRKLRSKNTLVFLVIFCVIYLMYFGSQSNSYSNKGSFVYTIIIDAGSTGSRIHVFKLFHDKSNEDETKKFDIKLINQELFVKVKPGLSSFANSPNEAAESIKPLLDKALNVIPKNYHKKTHISLKATAGLRMISDASANTILENIGKLFKKYPFIFHPENDVGIMDGKYEGIYSWVTLNYALKSFYSSTEDSVVSLDLGGGSTQVTFIPSKSIKSKTDVVDFKLDQNNYNIYAKSFLGFGLMSARMNIFNQDTLKFFQKNQTLGGKDKFSVCLPPNHSSVWTQQGVDYTVLGPKNENQSTFENCYKIAHRTIKNKIKSPGELADKNIYAFSFYFDRLKSAQMFDEKGGVLQLSDILAKAMTICNRSDMDTRIDKTDKDYPFLCMDLTFIYTILSQGLGIPNSKELNIHNVVNEMEINWALGAAFHMLKD